MLQKIPGIEPAQLQNVKDQTAKQVVRGSREIKITEKENEKQKREWYKPGSREELAALIEEVNEELEKAGYPLRFALVMVADKYLVEIRDLVENKVLRLISLAEAGSILGRALKKTGYLVDEKV
ncbi:MAG: flagellar protein FlaG [Clostridia bacterium]|nr:flagellar protein FlaG [Clostridia bacterium]